MPPNVGSSAATTSTSAVRLSRRDLDVEDVDAGELLEQDRLAFHYRLAGQRPDIAKAEHGRAIRHDGDQVRARREFGRHRRVATIASQAAATPGE